MRKRNVFAMLAVPAVAASLLLSGVPANAVGKGNTASKGYVIVNPSNGVKTTSGATFYPTGSISDSTLVVIAEPDGSLPGGLTEAGLQALSAQSPSQRAATETRAGLTVADSSPALTARPSGVSPHAVTMRSYAATSAGWSMDYTGGSVIGYNDSARVQYNFWAAGGTSQRNAGQGLGYYRGYNGGSFGVWSIWYNLGSATSSGGGASVPWGNVAAVAKFHARCATTTVCGGYFTP